MTDLIAAPDRLVAEEPAGPPPAHPGRRAGDEAVVVAATGVVSLLNYGYTLLLLWLLPTRQFAEAASISALLLICGTIAGAALPWVLAQEILKSNGDRARRRLAVTFCLFATVLQGAAAGAATCLIVVHYARGWVLVAAFTSVFFIFMAATVAGFFQGFQRFRLIAVLKVTEVVVKLGAGVGLIALGAGASGAVAGFALGAGVVAAVGLAFMARDITWSRSALSGRHLWASTQGLLAIQAGVAVLASMDVVIGSLVLGSQPALATYQAANILGRVPVFIGSALSIVVFPRMIAGRRHPGVVVRESVLLYVALCVPIAVVVASLPASLTGVLFPARYGDVAAILPWSALAGLMMGVVNLATTYFQATGRFRRTSVLLVYGVGLCAVSDVLGLQLFGVVGLAAAVSVGGGAVSAALMREVHRTWPGALRGVWRPASVVVAGCLPLVALRGHAVLWCIWALGCAVVFCVRSLVRISGPDPGPSGSSRPRVLHLGYEDPRRPGAGGGSVRTHEINRRLAAAYDITVVCARYRGAVPRVEDGVRYVHVGLASGDFAARLAYFAALPYALATHASDLVVEDFGAPFSSVAVPWMTGRPVLGVVQWLFAKEKSAQYHLPFHWVEALGVRSHRAMIAVSDDLGAVLHERNPGAAVTVIANGLDQGAYRRYDGARSGIVYLGRLETAQKGLDLLIEAYARIANTVDQDLVLGGDGPDRAALAEQAARLGVGHRVRFVGRVPAEERFEWLAGADLVAMPSRYETFGMVAAEALAVRTPVVAFDIPCLRALVDDRVGARVAAYDVAAFAGSLRTLANDAAMRWRLGTAGPARVAGLNWDELAAHQGRVYRHLVDQAGPGGPPVAAPGRSAAGDPTPGHVAPGHVAPGDVAPGDPGPEDLLVADPGVADPGMGSPAAGEGQTVVGLLAAQRLATPDRVALVDGDLVWSYIELHAAAAAVAEELRRRRVGPGDAVGSCLPRSKEAIAAMIGIWAAGATYVPLDPEYPANRLGVMAGQAGASLLIAHPDLAAAIDPSLAVFDPAVILPDAFDQSGSARPGRTQSGDPGGSPAEPDPDAVAYILFTSGSSGRPKAVEVVHRSLASVLAWVRATLDDDELAVTTTSISLSFDPFVLEVLGPLTTGGRVRVIPSALALADVDTGVTLLANTPSVLGELLRAGRLPTTLRTVIVGGETLSPSLATDLLTGTSITRLINTYGPTEATVLATAYEVTLPVPDTVPIGRDLPGARVVVLDERLREVPPGHQGELCIFGAQVANGYRGDPAGTAERFVPVTLEDGSSVRIYRTGDLGRRHRAGVLEFAGRHDRQLKLRGYRVEPDEVEAVLCRHPGVGQAVVTVSGEGGRALLVAHVTAATGVTPAEVRAWLRGVLPAYLVPAHVVVVPSFPMTANGKVAVDLLPRWEESRPAGSPVAVTGPPAATGDPDADEDLGDSRQAVVAALARTILGFEGPIHPTDDVLEDLGASSLALFQLLTLIEQEFRCRIEIGRILGDTTVAGLAALVGSGPGSLGFLSVNAGGAKRPIFMVHAYLGTALRYRRLGSFLSGDRPLVGIQVQELGGPTRDRLTSIEEMAVETVLQIRSIQPDGPYLLGGHSAGGLVAYEAARRLADAGDEVSMVVLIDSPVPRSRLHYLWAEAVLNWPDVRSGDRVRRYRRIDTLPPGLSDGSPGGLPRGVVRRFHRYGTEDRVGATVSRAYRASKLAVRSYQPGPYAGALTVMRTAQGAAMALGRDDLGWKAVASGPLATVEIPGLHNSVFEAPQVELVGRRLDEVLDQADQDALSPTAVLPPG